MEANKYEEFDLLEFVKKNDTDVIKLVISLIDSLTFSSHKFLDNLLSKNLDIQFIDGIKLGSEFCLTKNKILRDTLEALLDVYKKECINTKVDNPYIPITEPRVVLL